MSEWKTYRLGDLCSRIKSGKGIPASEVSTTGEYPVIGGNGIRGYTNTSNFNGVCAVVGRQGAYCGNVRFFSGEAYMTEHAVVIVGNELADTRYLAYLLSIMQLGHLSAQSAQPGLSVQTLSKLSINIPDISTQRRIVGILGSLDDKIELNRRINANLEAQAQALFRSWFVDFEPFRDGPFVDSELGKIPKGWKVGNLLDIAELFDVKRKPLSSREREKMQKIYPYYGATSIMDFVDNYIFDGIYLLMGEDGSVANIQGFPYLQYVFGKFWPNNHAHVMQGKNGYTTEMLHCLLLRKNITSIVTGAVQPKISQTNMRKILVPLPPYKICSDFVELINPIYSARRNAEKEIFNLSALRDTLLPKLMAGEIAIE